MALTDTAIRQSKPADKARKLADGNGLYLWIGPNGSKLWRLDYRFNGKRKTLSLGPYPDVTLAMARGMRDDARRLLASDIDPCEYRKAQKAATAARAANSFEAIAREWYARMAPGWAPSHGEKIIRRLERDIFPWLGAKPISEISAPDLLTAIRRIENRGRLETAHRALQNCSQVFRYAIATARAERDPAADLRHHRRPVAPESRPRWPSPSASLLRLRRVRRHWRCPPGRSTLRSPRRCRSLRPPPDPSSVELRTFRATIALRPGARS